jgi:signal transduction histidine kinase
VKKFDRPLTNIEYRAGILIGYVLYGLFGIVDYYLMPFNYETAWVVRAVTFIPAVIIFLLSYFEMPPKHIIRLLFILFQFIIISFSVILFVADPAEIAYRLYPYGYVLILLWFSLVLQMPFKQNLFLVSLIVIFYLLITFVHQKGFYEGYNRFWVMGNTVLILCSVSLVITGSYFINRHIKTVAESKLQLEAEHTELVLAKLKAEESDRLKSTFLANLSHEIRTPLNAIGGFSELMAEEDSSKEDQKMYAQLIQKNSEDLIELIEEIIEFSRIESGQANVVNRDMSVSELINKITADLSNLSKNLLKEGVKFVMNFNLTDDCLIYIDDYKIRQIVKQLTHNALKFTSQGHIEVGIEDFNGKTLTFYVEDTGIGFNPEDAKIIFSRFTQANKTIQHKYGGTGIGLSIVKQLVDLMSGELSYTSTPGTGTTFTFAVPCLKTS